MKYKALIPALLALLGFAVIRRGKVVTTDQGTFRLIRPQSAPDANGVYDIELWSKDGVDPEEYVYRKHVWADGTFQFTRMLA